MEIKTRTSPSLLLIAIIIIGCVYMKFWYSQSTVENLFFILKPINQLVQLAIGSSSIRMADGSYYYSEIDVLIDKSCSGFNFLIICWGSLSSLFYRSHKSIKVNILSLFKALGLAYLLTIFTNTSRVIISIHLLRFSEMATWLASSWFHEALGSFIYLTSLLLTYLFLLKKPYETHAQLT
ncbi:exosortase K [uncultured Roseivirga sp.]|uniref:exosortase K n=1 Tax=uncultured Roseivirga sp. TaxID=543088 RepID=UPI0030DCE682